MKKSKVIKKYYDKIKEAMVDGFRTVIESDGNVQVKVYIWEDGETETLEMPCGDNASLFPEDWRHYVCTISEPCFNVWDAAGATPPEDEESEEFDREWEAAVDWLVEEYEHSCVEDILDDVINQSMYYE